MLIKHLFRLLLIINVVFVISGCVSAPTPLTKAAKKGDLPEVRRLIAEGADINAKDQDDYEHGATALILASANGYREIVQLLLDKGANVNAKMSGIDDGVTALMEASKGKDVKIVQALLDKGANVNAEATMGATMILSGSRVTALTIACLNGDREIIQLLLSKGAEGKTKNDCH